MRIIYMLAFIYSFIPLDNSYSLNTYYVSGTGETVGNKRDKTLAELTL